MSVVHRFTGEDNNFNWEGAISHGYAKPNARGADGKVLIGKADGAQQFIIRYFRVEPGGCSALENHPHDHGIFILHGRARVLLGSVEVEVGPRDAVYISPNETHQLSPIGDEALGFLCVVPPKENEISGCLIDMHER
ncbi:MAG: cupin domain-containing protein [Dissulfurispiraceae bacterium]